MCVERILSCGSYIFVGFQMADEGYIKFDCVWIRARALSFSDIEEIDSLRDKLYGLGLIGAHDDGVGFGNVSVRVGGSNEFVISGSATGGLKKLSGAHYCRVVGFDFRKNWLRCVGPVRASSESLSHAAVYLSCPDVNAVVHVHCLSLWKKLYGKVPTTSSDALYGTPEMAREIVRLLRGADACKKRVIVMGGHEEGILAFGKDLSDVEGVVLGLVDGV